MCVCACVCVRKKCVCVSAGCKCGIVAAYGRKDVVVVNHSNGQARNVPIRHGLLHQLFKIVGKGVFGRWLAGPGHSSRIYGACASKNGYYVMKANHGCGCVYADGTQPKTLKKIYI